MRLNHSLGIIFFSSCVAFNSGQQAAAKHHTTVSACAASQASPAMFSCSAACIAASVASREQSHGEISQSRTRYRETSFRQPRHVHQKETFPVRVQFLQLSLSGQCSEQFDCCLMTWLTHFSSQASSYQPQPQFLTASTSSPLCRLLDRLPTLRIRALNVSNNVSDLRSAASRCPSEFVLTRRSKNCGISR